MLNQTNRFQHIKSSKQILIALNNENIFLFYTVTDIMTNYF